MMHPHLHPEFSVGPLSKKYLVDSRLHVILRQLLRDEPLAVQSVFYFKQPGARGQDLHQDNFYLRVKPGTCVAAWIALDDADQDNRGMVCVPSCRTGIASRSPSTAMSGTSPPQPAVVPAESFTMAARCIDSGSQCNG